jgi:ADP-ribosyl-[dinitrogen reductase] hydrolase
MDVGAYAAAIGVGGGGVSGYVNRTVPVALAAWLRQPGDMRAAVESVVVLGGDTDTTGAIAGALVGATVGSNGVPGEWLAGIAEWPRSVAWVRRLGERLDSGGPPVPLLWPALPVRNAVFAVVVVCHALRRLLPPW